MAAWNNNLRVLERLVEQVRRGENIAGYGPAHFAASLGNVEVLEFLLANGIDKNERDSVGNSPLMWVVASNGREELMDALVDHGVDVNQQNFVGEAALFLSCQMGHPAKVEYLLENGAAVNLQNLDGAFPLHAAAALGDLNIIDSVVRYGAHLDAVDHEGDSALIWAVREGKIQAVRHLIKLGADVNVCNEDGESALDLAVCLDDREMASALSFRQPAGGASVDAKMALDVEMVPLSGEMHGLSVKDLEELQRVTVFPPATRAVAF